jgi:hypothetical protein
MLNNLFKNSSKRITKLSLALRALIGTISMAAYVQSDIQLAFWFLVIGAVLDFVIQLLPPETEIKTGAKILVGLVAISVLCFSGCSKKVHPESITVSVKDSTIINYKSVDVPIPDFKVNQGVNIDSLLSAFKAADANGSTIQTVPVIVKDESGKVQLQYWLDQHGKLQITCESKDQTIQMLVAEVTKARNETKTVYKTDFKTPAWNYVIIILLGCALILSLFKR